MKPVFVLVLLCVILSGCNVELADIKEPVPQMKEPACNIDIPTNLTFSITFWDDSYGRTPDTSILFAPPIPGWTVKDYTASFPCTWGEKTGENVNYIYCRKMELSRQPVSPEGIIGELETHRVKIELIPIPNASYVTHDPNDPKFLKEYKLPAQVGRVQCGWDE